MLEVHADPLPLLRTRTSEKWTVYPADVLPLFVAEMDYPLAPVVAQAMIERIAASDTGYVASPGPLAPAFAAYAARTWDWAVDPAAIATTTDVSVAIVESLRAVIGPGDRVVITPPVYPPFFDLIPEAGGHVVEVPLLDDGGWGLDLPGIEAAFAAGARALLLCHPHNPLGLVHSAQSLAGLAELAARFGATVIADEIHAPLVHPGVEFTPYLTVGDGIAVTSASKAWNLAGVKCAVAVPRGERAAAAVAGLPAEVGFRTSILGLHASVAAYRHGGDWLEGVIAAIVSNRDLLGELLRERLPAVHYREPSAGYLAWLDFRGLGWGDDPAARILDRARVALIPGPAFGAEGRGFARLNLACSPEVLTEAIDRIARAA